jgi:hypothetical protein
MTNPAPNFLTLARDPQLDQETAFTICRLIDRVGWDLKEDWDWNWLEKKRKNYRKLIDPSLLEQAWEKLFHLDWLSLQTVGSGEKRISTIEPLSEMTNLESLVLQDNLIRDLRPLAGLTRLRYLNCCQNKISDFEMLGGLRGLEDLTIPCNPANSLRVLETLPHLRELSLSLEQLPAFLECKRLPRLVSLGLGLDGTIEDFEGWPDLPALKVLRAPGVKSLAGVERFKSLETLDLFRTSAPDLSPLGKLARLTHLEFSASKPRPFDLEPLGQLHALRSLRIVRGKVRGLHALARSPVLHEVRLLEESTYDDGQFAKLTADLTGWDSEFKTEKRSKQPALHLEVVDQAMFDLFDSKRPFGVKAGDFQTGMFLSERLWLIRQLSEALRVDFQEDLDFQLPHNSGFRRSERLIVYSLEAYERLRDVVSKVQEILCDLRHDWIIWCQSLLWEAPEEQDIPEGIEDFIIWIYPDKIVTTTEHAPTVRKLIESWD